MDERARYGRGMRVQGRKEGERERQKNRSKDGEREVGEGRCGNRREGG